jgi:hypothetical protein
MIYWRLSVEFKGDRIRDPCFFCSPRSAWATEETWISNTIPNIYSHLITFLALKAVYPEHQWQPYDRDLFNHLANQGRGSKSQSVLFEMLQAVFPDTPILSNFRLPAHLESDGLRYFEFDVSSFFYIFRLQL